MLLIATAEAVVCVCVKCMYACVPVYINKSASHFCMLLLLCCLIKSAERYTIPFYSSYIVHM